MSATVVTRRFRHDFRVEGISFEDSSAIFQVSRHGEPFSESGQPLEN